MIASTSGAQHRWVLLLLFLGAAALCRATTAAVAEPGQVNYSDFSSTTGLNLNGAAGQVGNCLRLTPARDNSRGAAWFITPQPVATGFTTTFQFRITEPGGIADCDGNLGADGFAFVVQNDSSNVLPGGSGGDIGYAGILNSLAVEFDTWNNYVERNNGDVSGNHVSVQTRGMLPNSDDHRYSLGASSQIPDLSDGSVHTATVYYRPGAMTVSVDAAPPLTVPVDLSSSLTPDNGKAWVGFTAATGGAYENHDILSWSFLSPSILAEQVVGGRYRYGGKGYDSSQHRFLAPGSVAVSGVDCSGLILWAYNYLFYGDRQVEWEDAVVTEALLNAHGRRWPECVRLKASPVSCAGANAQYLYNSYRIDSSELLAGDVVYIDNPWPEEDHIIMYVGEGSVVSAGDPNVGIVKEPLAAWKDWCADHGSQMHYRRVGKPDLAIIGYSPVDLIITDPYGQIISKDLCTVHGADYLELDIDGDGDVEDYVSIGVGAIGDYVVQVIPQAGASPDESYGLWVGVGDQFGWLAQAVTLSDIPTDGYQFHSTIPEPATLSLLPLGGLAMIRRGRKQYRRAGSLLPAESSTVKGGKGSGAFS